MARKIEPKAAPAQTPMNEEATSNDLLAADERAGMLAEINEKFGDGATYAKDRIIVEAKFFYEQGNQAAFELGKRLILLKEHEGHGGYLKALESLDIDRRVAWRLMTNTAKFANVREFGHLPQQKLLALSFMDDAEIDALAKGGTVAGLVLDDIDCMSVREMKATIIEAREKIEIADAQVAKKNKKLDEYEAQLSRRSKAKPWDQEIKDFSKGLRGATDDLAESTNALTVTIVEMAKRAASAPEDQQMALAHAVYDDVNRFLAAAGLLQQMVAEEFGPLVNQGRATLQG